MSPVLAPLERPSEASRPAAVPSTKKPLLRRLGSGAPLLITVLVHLVLAGIAGAVVVRQNSVAKKKSFEAAPVAAAPAVEHRLQIARRGGASGGVGSPVSANRIFSASAGALALPEMPDLPASSGGFGGFGGMGSGVGLGGAGLATSLGGAAGLGGRGFMSLSFLGATSPNASRIVFVVDTSTAIMAPAKGGFRAFSIIREEIMRLVGRLPPEARFNVVLFRSTGAGDSGIDVNLFQNALVPAASDQKKDFFAWMAPVNAKLGDFGPGSASRRASWVAKPVPADAGVDPLLLPPVWARATQAALEQEPDTIFVITATPGHVRRRIDEATLARRRAEVEKKRAEFAKLLEREGLAPEAYFAARERALKKAAAELAAANRRLVSEGKDPIVVDNNRDIFSASVQAELKRRGITIALDRSGWSKKDGTPITPPTLQVSEIEGAEWTDFSTHLARLQRHYSSERATLNIFLFVGPDENTESAAAKLGPIAKRNGGVFQLLTAKRLEELGSAERAGGKE